MAAMIPPRLSISSQSSTPSTLKDGELFAHPTGTILTLLLTSSLLTFLHRYLGAARNTAAKQATGKYLLFLDDDNVAYPHQISTYVRAAQKTQAHVLTAGHAVVKGISTPSVDAIDR
jgi:hypothetical protein